MSKEQDKQAFENAISSDRYDWTTRKIFSDWLEEHGYDDEALVQRKWTPEKQRAEDWLRDLADKGGETCINYNEYCKATRYRKRGDPEPKIKMQWRKITYEDIIQAGYDYLDNGKYFTQIGSEKLRDLVYDKDTLTKFWKCWSLVIERKVSGDVTRNAPFSCSC